MVKYLDYLKKLLEIWKLLKIQKNLVI
jgi:hypothetical protein